MSKNGFKVKALPKRGLSKDLGGGVWAKTSFAEIEGYMGSLD